MNSWDLHDEKYHVWIVACDEQIPVNVTVNCALMSSPFFTHHYHLQTLGFDFSSNMMLNDDHHENPLLVRDNTSCLSLNKLIKSNNVKNQNFRLTKWSASCIILAVHFISIFSFKISNLAFILNCSTFVELTGNSECWLLITLDWIVGLSSFLARMLVVNSVFFVAGCV